MGEYNNGHVSNLFEDGWFFGNTLLNTSSTSKIMVRCNSDPCSSSSSKEDTLVSQHPSIMSSLLRTPSLPLCFGRDKKYQLNEEEVEEEEEEEEEEDDEPRMGDLIRQAMPMPMPMPMPRRRLDRTPSLPPSRGKEALIIAPNVQNEAGVRNLTRRESVDSSVKLPEKGPIAMAKLTRRASIDSSLLLPPKCNSSKSNKQSTSNSKNRAHRKLEPPSITQTKPQKLDKSQSQKSLTDLEVEELQGFKDLGFSFDNKDLSPNVTQILPALQRRASLDSNHVDHIGKVRRPYLSESWQKPSSPLSAPPALKWDDQKASSSEDMKSQIKFWARAVASNVRQEC